MRTMDRLKVTVIIPALNEGGHLAGILKAVQTYDWPLGVDCQEIVVCDNGSTDDTFLVAKQCGVTVVQEPRRGYGYACAKAIDAVEETDILLFINADGAEVISDIALLLDVMASGADLCVGSRLRGQIASHAMWLHQQWGNRLSIYLINRLFGTQFSDLGPFRAIRFDRYKHLAPLDKTFGWIIEMQLKAVEEGLWVQEVPVTTRASIGASKISGTLSGTLGAGYKILSTIARFFVRKCVRKCVGRLNPHTQGRL